MDTSLKNKRALVTGAGAGIGREIAEAFAKEGASVAVHGRSLERISDTLNAINNNGGKAVPAIADLRSSSAINEMCQATTKQLGGLDILVNNAGVCSLANTDEMKQETWETILETNLTAPFLITQAVYSSLKKSGTNASVIFISSIAANAHTAGWGAYAASKSGLDAFMHCLADELGVHGVRVNTIAPGWVETKMAKQVHKDMASETNVSFETLYDESMRANMLSKILTADSIADMAVFLASERSKFITAQTLAVCGGDQPGR